MTPFFSAYLYLFLALGAAVALFRTEVKMRQVLATGLKQAWRALAAMALFGAMGQIIAYSGYGEGFIGLEQARNIPWVLAMGLKSYTGSWYPLFVPLLGWMGTFLTGYGVGVAGARGRAPGGVCGLAGRGAHRGVRGGLHFLPLQNRHCRAHVRRPGPGRGDSPAHHPPGPGRVFSPGRDSLGSLALPLTLRGIF
jgi:hypothetical protein